nr:non-ribosomal peptide synthetase [Streptomyces tendae]
MIHELVADRAVRHPEAPAVTCAGRSMTYGELDQRADALGRALRARGAGAASPVALLMERSPELVTAMLAVLKAGSAYLVLNPDDPDQRLAELAFDANVALVLTTRQLSGRVPASLDSAVLDDLRPVHTDASSAPPTRPSPDHLAYVCYTSGSTGAPKGVGVTHRGVVRLVHEAGWMRIGPADTVLHAASPSFDASTLEIFGALCNGGRLVVHPAGRIDFDALARTIVDERVTVMNLPTGVLHQLIQSRLADLGGLRHVITGGDVASPALVTRLLEAHPHLLFTNGYGPTENTTFTTCWTSRTPPTSDEVPIGWAVDGTRVALLDADLSPVPDGAVAELHASGAGLAWGYLGRPAETAERFLPDPAGLPGARMYRTGDLVRRLPEGGLGFVGRVDRQVKVQGFRVEPGSVEAALAQQPEVAQAVVVAEPDRDGRPQLVGHVVAADPDAADDLGTVLRRRLRELLPAYSVPHVVLVRSELPLNRNGKVDHAALATHGRTVRNIGTVYVPPTDELQHDIAELWADLLDTQPIGIEDDFFDLGGHSLLAAELLEALQARFDAEIPAATLYLHSTIAELSVAVRQAQRRKVA